MHSTSGACSEYSFGPRWRCCYSRTRRTSLQRLVAGDLASDIADDPAEIGAQLLQRPVGALELLGVGIALMLDQSKLAQGCLRRARRTRTGWRGYP
jgi:hypothetical protein